MSNDNKTFFNDEFDITTILSVLFDNINILFSAFISSIFVVLIVFLSSENIYQSESLLEIKREESTLLPSSFMDAKSLGQNSLDAEIEIYKSENTISDALKNIGNKFSQEEIDLPSSGFVRGNLILKTDSVSLITITYKSNICDHL